MSVNLLDLVKDQVTGALVGNASKFLGESSDNTSSALGSIFPSILGKVVDMGSDEKGASSILDLVNGTDDSVLDDIGGIFSKGSGSVNGLLNSGSGLLSGILGNKVGGLVDLVTGASGMKSSSSSSLMKMAAPFLFAIIKRKLAGKGVSALMSMLSGQKSHVSRALPSGVGSLLGLSSFGDGILDKAKDVVSGTADKVGEVGSGAVDAGKKVVSGTADVVGDVAHGTVDAGKKVVGGVADAGRTVVDAAPSGGGILKWLLLGLLALLGLGYFGMRTGCNAVDNAAESVTGAAGAVVETTGDAVKGAADVVGDVAEGAVDLASSAFANVNAAAKSALDNIKFAAGSAGAQMMDFIDGGFKGDGRVTFKNLSFASGSAAITGATAAEVDNLAAILKAYPDVKLSIDGYTDNTGNADANLKLSKDRADAVKARLAAQGINSSRITTRGFGAASPVASNDTNEGRAQNRRIEATIVK